MDTSEIKKQLITATSFYRNRPLPSPSETSWGIKKSWGVTQAIFLGAAFEVHRIVVKQGGYCSRHYHSRKCNKFFVESGALQIEIYRDEIDLPAIFVKTLRAEESYTVVAGLVHRFVALENTVAYEIYWTDSIGEDIIRLSEGGNVNESISE